MTLEYPDTKETELVDAGITEANQRVLRPGGTTASFRRAD